MALQAISGPSKRIGPWIRILLSLFKRGKTIRDPLRLVTRTLPPLNEFGKQSDLEFVEIAKGVSTLQEDFAALRTQADEILRNLSPDSKDNIFNNAFAVGKQAVELVHSSIGMEYALKGQFEALEALMKSSEAIRAEFDQNRIVFRSLSVGFAMEAARCDLEHQSVFKTVATDFQRIDASIEKTINGSFEEIRHILVQLNKYRKTWLDRIGGSNGNLDSRLEKIRQDIYQIELDLAPCYQSSKTFSETVETLNQSLLPIMMSLQSQDMTRQRIEHVVSALEKLQQDDAENGHRSPNPTELLPVAKLQQKQLAETRSLITDSGNTALNGIQSSLRETKQVANQLAVLQEILDRRFGNSKLVYTFRENIDAISNITTATQTVHEEIANLDDEIRSIIHRFNTEIAARQHDIRLIALNAQVAASRLLQGGALERLAQETALVAIANQKTSKGLAQALEEALSNLSHARDLSISQVTALEEERKDLESRTQNIDTELIAFIQANIEKSQRLQEATDRTQSSIQSMLDALSFPSRIESDFTPAQDAIDSLVSACQKSMGKNKISAADMALLQQEASQYTMESERTLHMETCAELATANGDLELF